MRQITDEGFMARARKLAVSVVEQALYDLFWAENEVQKKDAIQFLEELARDGNAIAESALQMFEENPKKLKENLEAVKIRR